MKITTVPVIVILCVSLATLPLHAGDEPGIISQQEELARIKKEVTDSQKKLDSLHAEQLRVSAKVTEYDQRITSDRKIIRRLNRQLRELKDEVKRADQDLQQRQTKLDRLQRRYLGNIRQFYFAASSEKRGFSDLPERELEMHRQVIYLTALAGFESENVAQESNLLMQAIENLDNLTGQKRMVSKLKKKKETSIALGKSQRQKQQKDLDRLRRSSREEADRVLTLQKAAEEMEAIIARLEEERRRQVLEGSSSVVASVFATLKGQLPSPFDGKVVVKFGSAVNPVNRLKSFSPGIVIKGRPGGSVRAVASGTVAYAGNLRGYGNFVIINHDNQYYTTYAGLDEVLVSPGQYLQAQTELGAAANDGVVRFELRKGRELLDPVKWIRIESL